MNSLISKIYLFISGTLIMLVGFYISIMTIEYLDAMTLNKAQLSINMMSDLRGMGGLLFVMGGVVFLSQFFSKWQLIGGMVSVVVFASFVVFRSIAIVLDGVPDTVILVAYLIEFVLALFGFLLIKRQSFETSFDSKAGDL